MDNENIYGTNKNEAKTQERDMVRSIIAGLTELTALAAFLSFIFMVA